MRKTNALKLAAIATVFVALSGGCGETQQQISSGKDVLIVGASEEPQTLDPQYGLLGQIQQATLPFVYEPLFFRQKDARTIYPLLAESHRFLTDRMLEVTLRKDIVFSDGSSFDAEDVAFTFKRLANPPGAAIPIKYISDVLERVEVLSDHKVVFHLSTPNPGFVGYLVEAPILSSEIGLEATPGDFNTLKAAIGTGPYRITKWSRGEKIVYEQNEKYWGETPHWKTVELTFMPNHAARVAALMAGDIHLTNYIPTTDIPRLLRRENVEVVSMPANRAIYFHLDIGRRVSPHITDLSGQPIENPLRDRRVREALSLAIDRPLIVEKILEGYATPAYQWMAPGYFGHDPDLKAVDSDRKKARTLLAEAGYEDGFRFTLHGTAGLYGPDVKVLQAMAAMWAKIGLEVEVEALPPGVYWGPWVEREFSVSLSSYGFHHYRTIPIMSITLQSDGYDNVGGYVNPQIDVLLDQAPSASLQRQQELLAEVSRLVYEDVALLPVYHFRYLFAYRSDHLTYDPTENLRDLEVLGALAPTQTAADRG